MNAHQMDLKTFGEADFDPKVWINKAWSSSGNQEKEIFVANAVSRLQLYMKQLTNSLDETTTQIVASIPRVMQDAAVLQEEGVLLYQSLLALEQKVQSVQEQTGHSIESLQRIDRLKSKLENAASTLQEADKWESLTSSLENILEAGVPSQGEELNDLSAQVSAMTQSLEVLSEASDYDRKRVQLETLYNRLEAAISPPLIDALTQMDAERTAWYVGLFGGMGRRGAARVCWRRAAAARLAAAWRRLDAHSPAALTRLLAPHALSQIDWLTNVLQSDAPLTELVKLYTDLLLSLDPSPTKLASANLKLCANAEEGVLFLIDLRRDLDEFVASIKSIVDAPRATQEYLPATVERDFARASYAPLRELLPKYTDLQTQLLNNHLNSADLKQDDLLEHSRAVLALVQRCEGWLEAAYSRSKKIAGVAAYPFYVPAVENFMSSLTSVISGHARRIEAEFLSSVSAGRATGVLSDTFAASLVLEGAAAALLDTAAARHQAETAEPVAKDVPTLQDVCSNLLEGEGWKRVAASRGGGGGGNGGGGSGGGGGWPASGAALSRARDHLAALARNILKEPVETQLEKIPMLPAWSNNDALTTDLPDFALSPQEYITEIGQYLMTLPQHLEMHMAEKQAPWQYLSEVCVHTCDVYAQKILTIRDMDELGTRRCLTDIVYLSSVVEDLGSSITPALRSLEASLRAAAPEPRDH